MIHEHHEAFLHTVPWYAIVIGVLAGLLLAIAVTLVAYKCYKRQHATDEEALHINTAIQRSINESGLGGSTGITLLKPQGKFDSALDQGWIANQRKEKEAEGKSRSPVTPVAGEKCEHVEDRVEKEQVLSPDEKDQTLIEKCINEKQALQLGQLHFDVEYDDVKSVLKVTVIKATALPPKNNVTITADPYVKLHLLPEKKQRVKTRVLRKTLNPVYDEVFTFYGVDLNQLQTVSLHFIILSFDRYSRDEVIGEVLYPLANADLGKKEVPLCKNISPRHMKMNSGGRGEILLSMCYQPAANRLTVVILKARNLPKADVNGLSDPYVKVYLKANGQRIDKKKSQVKKHTINPVFNQSFIFDIPPNESLQMLDLEFQVLEWDRMTKNEVIGRVDLGIKFEGLARKHLEEVINCPRKQIAEWHKLKE